MKRERRILVVSAHSDDEALGCGATLRRHAESGDKIFCLSLTDGVGARRDPRLLDEAGRRRVCAEQSAKLLGFEWVAEGSFPDNALDSVPLLEVARFVETAKSKVRPSLVYTHHGGDLNVDHRTAFQAVLTAFRPQPGDLCEEIRTFEVASSTEWSHQSIGPIFVPQLFVDVTATWGRKLDALAAYEDEMRPFPHVRSREALDALSTWRGAQVGLARAEAFEIVRRIVGPGDE